MLPVLDSFNTFRREKSIRLSILPYSPAIFVLLFKQYIKNETPLGWFTLSFLHRTHSLVLVRRRESRFSRVEFRIKEKFGIVQITKIQNMWLLAWYTSCINTYCVYNMALEYQFVQQEKCRIKINYEPLFRLYRNHNLPSHWKNKNVLKASAIKTATISLLQGRYSNAIKHMWIRRQH